MDGWKDDDMDEINEEYTRTRGATLVEDYETEQVRAAAAREAADAKENAEKENADAKKDADKEAADAKENADKVAASVEVEEAPEPDPKTDPIIKGILAAPQIFFKN